MGTVYRNDVDDGIPSFITDKSDKDDQHLNDFFESDYHLLDELYATEKLPNPNDHVFAPIEPEELVSVQMKDWFCSEIRRRLDGGNEDDNRMLIRTSEAGPEIVVQDILE